MKAVRQLVPVQSHRLAQRSLRAIPDDRVANPARHGQAHPGRPRETCGQGEHRHQSRASPDPSIIDCPEFRTPPKAPVGWERAAPGAHPNPASTIRRWRTVASALSRDARRALACLPGCASARETRASWLACDCSAGTFSSHLRSPPGSMETASAALTGPSLAQGSRAQAVGHRVLKPVNAESHRSTRACLRRHARCSGRALPNSSCVEPDAPGRTPSGAVKEGRRNALPNPVLGLRPKMLRRALTAMPASAVGCQKGSPPVAPASPTSRGPTRPPPHFPCLWGPTDTVPTRTAARGSRQVPSQRASGQGSAKPRLGHEPPGRRIKLRTLQAGGACSPRGAQLGRGARGVVE